jgi:CRP/FNR family cyclic AMP-dependent transcriptional regulator
MLGATSTREAPVTSDAKLDLLRRIPLFMGLDRHQIERLGQLAEEVDVPAGKMLIRQGDSGGDLMVLASGQVAVVRDGGHIRTLGPGDFFGEIALIDGGLRTATITTEEPSRLVVLGRREFHAVMDEFPEVASRILATMADRIRSLDEHAGH